MVRGPVPKPNNQTARRNNKGMHSFLEVTPVEQPYLPEDTDPRAVEWWECWRGHPLSASFTMLEWETLKLAIPFYSAGLDGNSKAADTFLKITAKFGLTTEDRLRLRMSTTVRASGGSSGASGERKTISRAVDV